MGFHKSFGILALALTLFGFTAKAKTPNQLAYYGQQFYQLLNQQNNSSSALETEVHRILSHWHKSQVGGFDEILEHCKTNNCYRHKDLSYKRARQILFGQIHLYKLKKQYAVEDVYCEIFHLAEDFPSRPPAPWQIPNHRIVNAEHTWPQSRFSSQHPRSLQKSDLHSLYSVDSRTNSSRGNDPFGTVDRITSQICPASKKGVSSVSGRIVFEPPDSHKGNVARALFYFSIRYDMQIDEEQENYLRQWHTLDPVDAKELQRNESIFAHQQNRNPFIDHPELVHKIADF